MYLVLPGVKAAGSWCSPPTPSKCRGHERMELYLYSPSGPQWPVLGRALPLPLLKHIIIIWVGQLLFMSSERFGRRCTQVSLKIYIHDGITKRQKGPQDNRLPGPFSKLGLSKFCENTYNWYAAVGGHLYVRPSVWCTMRCTGALYRRICSSKAVGWLCALTFFEGSVICIAQMYSCWTRNWVKLFDAVSTVHHPTICV